MAKVTIPPTHSVGRPSVSVALCTYNGDRFLAAQLESLLNQSQHPDEVVISDDGSEDQTLRIAEDFAQRAPFSVRIVRNDRNLGSTANFERAITLCAGDIITLSDQDDVWNAEKVTAISAAFAESPDLVMVFSNAILVDDSLAPLGHSLVDALAVTRGEKQLMEQGRLMSALLRRNLVTGSTMAIRSRVRPLICPFPPNAIHDAWIALLLSAIGDVRMIEEPLTLYRQHSSQQIGERKRSLFEQYRMARRMGLVEYLRVRDMFAAARERLWERAREQVAPGVFDELDRKIEHAEARVRMRESRWRRLPLVGREWARGNYRRYSLGWKSLAQDLFLP